MTLNMKNKFAAVLLGVVCVQAHALESDRRQPIAIQADQGSLDQKNQITVFSGNVVIQQGSLHIHAENVRVAQDKSGNQIMQAQGNPVKFGQQLENKGQVEGQGKRVEYSSATGVVKLSGNAQVRRGGDIAKGETITYNMRTEVYTVLGGKAAGAKNGGRVSVIIQPNGSIQEAKPAAKDKKAK